MYYKDIYIILLSLTLSRGNSSKSGIIEYNQYISTCWRKLGSETTVQKTVGASVSHLSEGEKLTVIGVVELSGNITAASIVAEPQ